MAVDANITGIEFEIRGNSSSAAKSIDQLKESLSKLKGAVSATGLSAVTSGLRNISDEAKRATRNVATLSSSLSKIKQNSISSIAKNMDNISNTAERTTESLNNLGNQIRKVGDVGTIKNTSKEIKELSDTAETASNSVSKIADSTKKVKTAETITQTSKQIKDLGEQAENTNSKISNAFSRGLSAVRNFGSSAFSALGGIAKKIPQSKIFASFTSGAKQAGRAALDFGKRLITTPFKKPIQGIQTLASKISGLTSAFKRIAFYRAIRTVIKEITQGFAEGVQNLRTWSESVGGEFSRSMDSMTTSMNYFKNSIGAMVAPLYNAFAPALDYIIDKVVDFINKINQLFALLTGASYWTKAKKVATGYAGAAGKAGSAAKEAMKYLAPFDELNVLPSDSGSGGGSGGGGAGGAGDLFETVNTFDSAIADFTKQLKDMINKGDWEGVGNLIADKIADALDKIPWAKIQEKAKTIATNLARTINGFVANPRIWDSLGKTIGEAINTAVETTIAFFTTVNWTKLGEGLVTALDRAIRTVKADRLGLALISVVNAGVDSLYGFLSKGVKQGTFTAVGEKVGEAIASAIRNVHWDKLGANIGLAITGLFNFISGLLSKIDPVKLGEGIKEAFRSMMDNIDWNNLGDTIDTMLSEFFETIKNAVDKDDLENFAKKVGETLSKVDWIKHLMSAIQIVWATIVGLVKGFASSEVGRIILFVAGTLTYLKLKPIGDAVIKFFTSSYFTNQLQQGIAQGVGSATAGVNLGGGTGGAATAGATGAASAASYGATGVVAGGMVGLAKAGVIGLGAWKITELLSDIHTLRTGTEAEVEAITQKYEQVAERGTLSSEQQSLAMQLLGKKHSSVTKQLNSNNEKTTKSYKTTTKEFTSSGKKIIDTASTIQGKFKKPLATLKVSEDSKSKEALKRYTNTQPKTVTVTTNAVMAGGFKPTITAYDEVKNKDVLLTADGKVANAFWITSGEFNKPTNRTVKLTSTGKTDKTFTDTTNTYNKPANRAITLTGKGVIDKTFTNTRNTYAIPANRAVTLTGKGVIDKTFTNTRNTYAIPTNRAVTLTSKGITNKTFTDTRNAYNKPANRSVTLTGKGNTQQSLKDTSSRMSLKNKTVTLTAKGGSDKNFNTIWNRYAGFNSKSVKVNVAYSSSGRVSLLTSGKTGTVNGKTVIAMAAADGAILTANGWKNIQQYANGGYPNGGQMFIAREAGPELVGTLRGTTAVMNNDQIVASVSSGVAKAISKIKFNITGLGDPMITAMRIMQTQSQAIEQGIEDVSRRYMTAQQDEDMEGTLYNAMLRALNDSDAEQPQEITAYLDGDVIYKNTIRRNQQSIIRTGVNPLGA